MAPKVRVFHYRGFLSEEECDHLVSLGTRDGSLGISDGNSDLVAVIEERISAWTFLPKEHGRPLKLTNHHSERPEEKPFYVGNDLQSESNSPLVAVVILYLNNVSRGGEILFPESQLFSDCTNTTSILKPAKGNALLFFLRHLNASLDNSSSHAQCPVNEGDMWYAVKSLYAKPIEKTRVTLETEDTDCTDEDENCWQWAKLGECQRNPVYMMGSPDYFGTCRKSCKVC